MNDQPEKAWQPLTFGGVARYGHDWVGRLFFACLVLSILDAAVVVWTASRTWAPAIEQAIANLPAGAEIRGGKLTAPQAVRLAENPFLSFRLDPRGEGAPASLGDLSVVLAPNEIRIRSLFGADAFPYRPEWTVQLSRAEMEPKWAAWKPALLAYLFLGTIIALFANWISLATVYALFVKIFAAAKNRSLTVWGAWKASVAALMPGAILLAIAIALYGMGQIRLVELIATWAAHFVVGWIFMIGAVFKLPPLQKTPANPFAHLDEKEKEEAPPAEKNPFRRPSKKK
jgi:hypothetical protein